MYIDYEDEFCMANAGILDDLNVQELISCKNKNVGHSEKYTKINILRIITGSQMSNLQPIEMFT